MDKELTVREAMLLVLDKSAGEFEKMKESFKRASDAFDMADDSTGLEVVSKEIFPHVRSLTEFCSSIYDYHLDVLGPEVAKEFCDHLARLNDLLNRLAMETDAGNFTEVGDILRFDLYDYISELDQFFHEIRTFFVDSVNTDLDKF